MNKNKKAKTKVKRVIVVDDSALIRCELTDIINAHPEFEVVATARDGEEALNLIALIRPEIITLDLELPKIDGILALKYIMSEWPTPTIIVTSHTELNGEKTIRCLEYGAVDFLLKPDDKLSTIKESLINKLKLASQVDIEKLKPIYHEAIEMVPVRKRPASSRVIFIAASTGGPRALAAILPELSEELNAAIVLVQHMPAGFMRTFTARLNEQAKLTIVEAAQNMTMRDGVVYVAAGGKHLKVVRNNKGEAVFEIHEGEKLHGVIPAADITMSSIAEVFKHKAMSVVLTGMGEDGKQGTIDIKNAGGYTVAESETTSVIYGMPKAAFETGCIDKVLDLEKIYLEIQRWGKQK